MPEQPLNYASVTTRGPANFGRFAAVMQFCAVVMGLLLSPFWCVLGIIGLPWIVIADSDFSLVHVRENASMAAFGAAVLTLMSVIVASGVVHSERHRWCVAIAIMSGHAAAACWLYRDLDLLDAPGRIYLLCQTASAGVVLIGARYGRPRIGEFRRRRTY